MTTQPDGTILHLDVGAAAASAPRLVEQAEELAERVVKHWTRSVMREVALQALKQSLSIDQDRPASSSGDNSSNNGDGISTTTTIVVRVSGDALVKAQQLCRLVANKWCEKLQQLGHDQSTEWMKQVVEEEIDILFGEGRTTARESTPVTTTQSQVGAPPHDAGYKNTTSSSSVTSLGRLNQIGRLKNSLRHENDGLIRIDPQTAMNEIDQLAIRNQLDWTFDWNLVRDKCSEIPSRLHNTKREKAEISVVPRAVINNNNEGSQLGGQVVVSSEQQRHSEEAQAYILQRKRKSRHKIRQSTKKSAPSAVGDEQDDGTEGLGVEVESLPRRASDEGDQCWSKEDRQLPIADQQYLQSRYLHQDPSSTAVENPMSNPVIQATILGSLRDTGRFHHRHQQLADDEVVRGTPPRRTHGRRRQSVNERLADHKPVQDTRHVGQSTRVVRTVDQSGRHWMDLDLGHCILDVEVDVSTDESGEERKGRKLYYFDSMEVSLLDEDK